MGGIMRKRTRRKTRMRATEEQREGGREGRRTMLKTRIKLTDEKIKEGCLGTTGERERAQNVGRSNCNR